MASRPSGRSDVRIAGWLTVPGDDAEPASTRKSPVPTARPPDQMVAATTTLPLRSDQIRSGSGSVGLRAGPATKEKAPCGRGPTLGWRGREPTTHVVAPQAASTHLQRLGLPGTHTASQIRPYQQGRGHERRRLLAHESMSRARLLTARGISRALAVSHRPPRCGRRRMTLRRARVGTDSAHTRTGGIAIGLPMRADVDVSPTAGSKIHRNDSQSRTGTSRPANGALSLLNGPWRRRRHRLPASVGN